MLTRGGLTPGIEFARICIDQVIRLKYRIPCFHEIYRGVALSCVDSVHSVKVNNSLCGLIGEWRITLETVLGLCRACSERPQRQWLPSRVCE
jgi:hypothetical protein